VRSLNLHQALVAVVALIGISVLGLFDKVSSEAVIAVYSMCAGGALGYVNGRFSAGK
jgi:lipoprotein signal peptidase